MKALIVDDDMPTVSVIQNTLHWKDLGVDEVLTAYDYAEAQNRIREHSPDIILCDIEMPRGSGLDLLQWLREENNPCEFVFLTCHANFDYAQMAIKYGAADYITKPFNIETTEATLRRVISRMMYRRQQMKDKDWLDERELAQAGFLRTLLFEGSHLEPSQLRQRFEALGLTQRVDEPVYLALASVPQSRVPEGWKAEQFSYAFRNIAAEIWGNLNQTRVFGYYSRDTHYCLAWFGQDTITRTHLIKCCERLCKVCRCALSCDVTCYISEPVPFGELASKREALELRDQRNVAHCSEVLYGSELPVARESPVAVLDMARLEALLQQGNVTGVANYVSNELQTLANRKQLTPDVLHHAYNDLLQLIFSVLQREGVLAHELFLDPASTTLGRNAEKSMFDFTKWLTFSVNRTVSFLKESRQAQTVTGRIEQFIRAHYAEHIDNSEIAAAVFLTPDYANRLFKAQNNISIKDYLTQYRIEQAKRLLMNPASNVSDVAAQIGMDNFSYFSTLFKKHTGLTPSEFRKNYVGVETEAEE